MSSSPARAAELLQALRADTTEALAEIRRIVHGLRPKALDELGLVGAVRQQTGRLLARDGQPFQVDVCAPDLPDLPAAVEVAAYRVAVEAVTNVARRADVGRAGVAFVIDDEGLWRSSSATQGPGPGLGGRGSGSRRCGNASSRSAER